MSKQRDIALLRLVNKPAKPLPALLVCGETPPLGSPIDGRADYTYSRLNDLGTLDLCLGNVVPGQSGTGVFINEKYAGMIVKAGITDPSKFFWIVPARQIKEFSEQLNCRWAFGNGQAPDQIYPLFIGE